MNHRERTCALAGGALDCANIGRQMVTMDDKKPGARPGFRCFISRISYYFRSSC